jgi:hypothetical protein
LHAEHIKNTSVTGSLYVQRKEETRAFMRVMLPSGWVSSNLWFAEKTPTVLPFFFNLSDFLFSNFQTFFSSFQNSIMDDDEP